MSLLKPTAGAKIQLKNTEKVQLKNTEKVEEPVSVKEEKVVKPENIVDKAEVKEKIVVKEKIIKSPINVVEGKYDGIDFIDYIKEITPSKTIKKSEFAYAVKANLADKGIEVDTLRLTQLIIDVVSETLGDVLTEGFSIKFGKLQSTRKLVSPNLNYLKSDRNPSDFNYGNVYNILKTPISKFNDQGSKRFDEEGKINIDGTLYDDIDAYKDAYKARYKAEYNISDKKPKQLEQ